MHNIHINRLRWGLVVYILSIFLVVPASAGFLGKEEVEKPTPTFSRDGDTITAKLIPRAKSTSVQILFKVDKGRLVEVKGVDFFEVAEPEVDVKNFKSALFEIDIDDISADGQARVSVLSDFFTSSTQFFIFNKTETPAWSDSGAQARSLPNRVQELVIDVKDGGPFDSDGKVDGKIKLIGGPRDSFWGYAVGTLFIRFFGIFLVLTVLMIGMILSGRFFQRMLKPSSPSGDTEDSKPVPQKTPSPVDPSDLKEGTVVSPETAAAIGVALHLHFTEKKQASAGQTETHVVSASWTHSGRVQIMNERLMMYNR